MSATITTQECTSKTCLDDESLVKQLTDLIKAKVSYSKRLDVLGILSYTTDNEKEKFLKIDISFNAIKEELSSCVCNAVDKFKDMSTNPLKRPMSSVDSGEQKDSSDPSNSKVIRCDQSPSSSPPLLPPLFIQHGRISRHEDKIDNSDDSRETSNNCAHDEINNAEDSSPLASCRRDRRKCRNPKRQIIDSNCRNCNSETPGVANDPENNNQTSELAETNQSAKLPRLEDTVNVTSGAAEISADSKQFPNTNPIQVTQTAILGKPVTTTFSTSGQGATNVSFLPLPYATIGTCFTPSVTSVDLPATTSQLAAGTKYTISAKSLGLGDIGELCGILPINALLGKSVSESAVSSKVLFANCAPSSSVSVSSSEPYNQPMIPSQLTACVSANSTPSQSFLLNPNLAAAVAAAISNSSLQSPGSSSTITCGTTQLSSSIPTFSTPTIALTGPSGELIGTIPIGNSASQSLLTSALGSNALPMPTSLSSALTSVNLALPGGVNTSSPSCLANTLNWLRCATAPDSPNSPLLNNLAVGGTSSSLSLNSNNPVALLHSLVTQQQQQQQQQQHMFQQPAQSTLNKQQPLSSFSVGPTLALIGTLGLNSPMSSSAVVSTSSTEPVSYATSGSLNSNPNVIATNISNTITGVPNNSATNNNGAAMVAAALLRSLANVKQLNQEQTDSGSLDSNSYTLPSSLTLIAGNVSQPNQGLSPATANILKTDDQSNLINSMITKPTVNSFSLSTVPASSTAGLVASLRNVGTPLATCVSTPVTRNSIMFSCPRGTSEMNLLLTSASAHSFGSSALASLTPAPTALSFHSLGSHPGSVALASPVLLQAPATSLGAVTTVVSATTTVTSASPISTLSSDQTFIVKGEKLSNFTSTENTLKSITTDPNAKHARVSDPTASAIDRILQTIKGCMSSNGNREQESKSKFTSRKTEGATVGLTSSSQDSEIKSSNDVKTSSSKTVSGTSKYLAASENDDGPPTESEGNLNSTNDRLILPSLHKGLSDTNENNAIPVSKVYRCRYCGKTFNRKFCRERHERLHTGVKPYTCEICDEKFIRLEDKKRHVRSLQHYLAGRCCSFQSEGDQNEELVSLEVEPSSILPLLAHTLQNGVNADSDIAYQEGGEIMTGNSEMNTGDPISDNGSDACADTQEADSSDATTDDIILKEEMKEFADTPAIMSLQTHEDCDPVKKEMTLGVISTLKLAAGNHSFNQRTKSRIVLRETQQDANSTTETQCEILTKLPTVLLVNADDILQVKSKAE